RTATRVGTIMGTPGFMAPEQARARWNEVDGRTDLFAVGATMFRALAGRQVHDAPTANDELILAATARADPLASVAPDVPAEVAAIVDKALACDRKDRWPDATTMQQAVRAALEASGGWEGAGSSAPSTGGMPAASSPRVKPVTIAQATALTRMEGPPPTSSLAALPAEPHPRLGA